MAEAVVAVRLVKDRYIVLFPYHVKSKQKPKHKPAAKTTQHKSTNTTKTTHTKQKTENHTAQKQLRDGYQLGEKDLLRQEVIA